MTAVAFHSLSRHVIEAERVTASFDRVSNSQLHELHAYVRVHTFGNAQVQAI